jgi:peptide deformylase
MGDWEELTAEVKRLQDEGKIPVVPTWEQRISFALGNAGLSNPNVTREVVERAALQLERERSISMIRPMRRPILIWPNQNLFRVSEPVSVEEMQTADFKILVNDMFETMKVARGVGLAAVQIGVHKRVFVMSVEGSAPYVFVNPVITHYLGVAREIDESCLSLPGVVERVKRFPEVTVRGSVNDGSTWTTTFRGLEAQCIQHENEHLYGETLADSFGTAKRQITKRIIKKTLAARRPTTV